MSNLIKVNEIIEFAVKIEENGYRFYVEAIKKIKLPKVTQLFQILGDEERNHQYIFKNMLKDQDPYIPAESYPGEYEAYMWDFLKGHSLASREQLKEKVNAVESVRDAVQVALQFEKDSIILFAMLKKLVEEEDGKKVEQIIQEEVLHIMKIKEFARELRIQL